jgi:16S rRNA processing protein RimM
MGERVCVGQIGAPHGVRGLVVVWSYTEVPDDICSYGPIKTDGGLELYLDIVSTKKNSGLIVAIDGVQTRFGARALSGEKLYIDRDRLPDPGVEEFYYADLVGLTVKDISGMSQGRVVGVHDFGAGDLMEIDPGDGKTILVPFTKEHVPAVDVFGKLVTINSALITSDGGEGDLGT